MRQTAVSELPHYLRSGFYWLMTMLMIIAGGILTLVYVKSGIELKPLVAINIGASAPLIYWKPYGFSSEYRQVVFDIINLLSFGSFMLSERLKNRLVRERPMLSITLRLPVDVVESMRVIAPLRGFGDYQTLLKAYIGEGLRRDEVQYISLADPAIPAYRGKE